MKINILAPLSRRFHQEAGFFIRSGTPGLAVLAAAGLFVGCGDGPAPERDAAAGSDASDPTIEAAMLEVEPADAAPVVETKTSAAPGDEVTITGVIAGAVHPFTDGYAAFVLADHSLPLCDPAVDPCPTPWDACCETPETIQKSRLTVQIVGDDGRPLAQSLKGVHGLTEADHVVVTGTVAEGSSPENVVINASGIFRKES